jgi:hypothetical protein
MGVRFGLGMLKVSHEFSDWHCDTNWGWLRAFPSRGTELLINHEPPYVDPNSSCQHVLRVSVSIELAVFLCGASRKDDQGRATRSESSTLVHRFRGDYVYRV